MKQYCWHRFNSSSVFGSDSVPFTQFQEASSRAGMVHVYKTRAFVLIAHDTRNPEAKRREAPSHGILAQELCGWSYGHRIRKLQTDNLNTNQAEIWAT